MERFELVAFVGGTELLVLAILVGGLALLVGWWLFTYFLKGYNEGRGYAD